jgi:hypothetical protein
MKPQRVFYFTGAALLIVVLLATAALLPLQNSRAQSDEGYHLATGPTSVDNGLLSGGRYTLVAVGARSSFHKSSGTSFHLTSLLPANVQQYDYGVCLPLVLKDQ